MIKTAVSIIIVTFNSEKYIEKCISSTISALPKNMLADILVVDNCSSDRTVHMVRSFVKSNKISVIESRVNLGFAKAVNLGIKVAKKSDFYLLLNPDTILNSNSIVNLITCAKENNAGIVGGTTLDSDYCVSGCYFRFPTLGVGVYDFTNIRKLDKQDRWHNYFYYLDKRATKSDCFPVDVVTGGYMLISAKTIEKIGYFDERFFMYLEDVDYCYRAKSSGIRVFHSNKSQLIHFSGGSSNNKDKVRHSAWITSRKKYFLKHFGVLDNLLIQLIFLIDDMVIYLSRLLKS